jgi:hypothetical protein
MTRRRTCPTCGADPRARDLLRALAALARAQAECARAVDAVWRHLGGQAHRRARQSRQAVHR